MKFQPEFIEKVRESNNILDVIGTHVQLTRSGASYRGLCPFPGHAERTPSFFVSEVKQVYHCFGCQKAGNVFTFLMDFQGLTFPESVAQLAERANIPIPEQSLSTNPQPPDESKLLHKLNRYVASYWHKNLNSKSPEHPVKQYLLRRNLSSETIEEFKIGFSEDDWNGLSGLLIKAKAPLPKAEQLGLIRKRKDFTYFDIFRNRLIFPIMTASGNVIGFGGRTLDDSQQPKYLNSPESPLFNKGRTLYGLHATAKHIRAEGEVILVEGYMDLVSLYQFGIKNVVATLGTALTSEHAKAILKLSKKVVVLFDSDEAGQQAAERSLPIFLEAGLLSRCLILKGAKDPDEFINKFGVEEFKKHVRAAPDHFTVFLNRQLAGFRGRATDKSEILSSIQPLLSRVNDQQLRILYLQEVADRLNIDTTQLARSKNTQNLQPIGITGQNQKIQKREKVPNDEKLLVQFVLVEREYLERIQESGVIEHFGSLGAKKLSQRIIERYCQNPSDFDKLASSILGENTDEVEILKEALSIFNQSRSASKEEERKLLEDCIAKVMQRSLRARSKEILNSIKADNASGEENDVTLQDFMKIAKETKAPKKST